MSAQPDREAFARCWAEAIIGTSYVSMGRGGLTKHLLGLTHQLVDAAMAAEFDPSIGRRIGAEMVAAHFTGTETLNKTLTLMVEGLPGLLGAAPIGVDVVGRAAQLTSNLAAGYANTLRERSLDEQDSIYRAGLRARRQAEQALAASEAKFRAVFAEAKIGIGVADLDGTVTDANPALQRLFGGDLEDFAQINVNSMVHPQDAPSVWKIQRELLRGERDHFRMEKRFYRFDGDEICVDLTVSLVRDEAGVPVFMVALLEDISERHRMQARLEHEVYHDALTGLANRRRVDQRLDQIFSGPAGLRRVGLCSLDLDGFKMVNDSLGHDVGDELLKAVASRLTRCCDSGQLVARMGGDEFLIVVEGTTGAHDLAVLAEEILAAIAAPILVRGHELTARTSIGVVERPVADTNPRDLKKDADITLYKAKADGKGRYAMFDRDHNDSKVTRYRLSAMVPAAVERSEFFLDYQPLVGLANGVLRGVEALVRWRHPTLGVLGPEQFIELAEETGSIVQLGHWVLTRACEQARRWQDTFGAAAPLVSVNLAPRQLHEPNLVAEITTILDDNRLDPSSLQLELTEQSLMGDDTGPLKALTNLYHMGVRIAIDDFGTGYSNFSYLRRLPMHELKLDRSFAVSLRPPDSDPVDERIVATLVSLAHALDLTMTAEGVETDDQRERFRALGCDSGQGSLFGLPGTSERIDAWLRAAT